MLEAQVLATIKKYGMLEPGDHILVAVSGGADSVALLHCLHRLSGAMQWKLAVAHFNHGIRGADADRDEEFVGRLAQQLGLPFVCERARLACPGAPNLEQAARTARYAFLRRAAQSLGARKIAVGHSLDDQAETVLSRLLRGSGVEGLSGIRPVVAGVIVRPLLECRRGAIRAYLRRLQQPFREDASNRNLDFERNRIRHELIPYLERNFQRRTARVLARQADLARETAEYLDAQAGRAYEALRRPAELGLTLPAAGILELPPIIRKLVVRRALCEVRGSLRGISMSHVCAVLALCRPDASGAWVRLPGNALAIREFEHLAITAAAAPVTHFYRYELSVPGRCEVPEAGMIFIADFAEGAGQGLGADRAALRSDALPASLVIRPWLPGDRYGGPGHRKLKKVFNQERIPLRERRRLPVVAAGEAVVWVPGLRPAKSFIARPGSGRCVLLQVRPAAPAA